MKECEEEKVRGREGGKRRMGWEKKKFRKGSVVKEEDTKEAYILSTFALYNF